ncbi:MAG: CCA tRNA nucleotidyltransferase [Candidatus Micrarchaeaceae archaeon]
MGDEKDAAIRSIFKHVLHNIKPTPKEIDAITYAANMVMARLEKVLSKNVEIILAGSVARGTQLKSESDIDIFLLFPKSGDERKMEKKGIDAAKKIVNVKQGESYTLKYSEHPYLQLMLKDPPVKVDIVPAFKIADSFELGSAVDRTPLHNDFIRSHLTEEQKDEVRILKAFMHNHYVYGADSSVNGFPGYLCELLIHYYGSAANVLKNFANISLPMCLDPKNKAEIKDEAVFKKFNSNFIVIDPTDQNRNVAAAVSSDTLGRFSMAASIFLMKQSLDAFYGPRFDMTNTSAKLVKLCNTLNLDVYAIVFNVSDITEDIIWQQIRRFGKNLLQQVLKSSFLPVMSIENVGEGSAVYAIFVNKKAYVLPIRGPSPFIKPASLQFAGSHSIVYISNNYLFAIEKAKYVTFKEFLNKLLNKDYPLPSYLKKSKMQIFSNRIPEEYAKLIYERYIKQTNF